MMNKFMFVVYYSFALLVSQAVQADGKNTLGNTAIHEMNVTVKTPKVKGIIKGKIGVLVEEHFDETELVEFQNFFPANGYKIEFISYLWGQENLTFNGNDNNHKVVVSTDITKIDLNEYDGIILIGGYAMDRLRYEDKISLNGNSTAPAVEFLRKVVKTNRIKIGTICHSLWLFTAAPDLLKGKKVTAASNIMSDVRNAGAILQIKNNKLVDTYVDGNLISGRHPAIVNAFMKVFLNELNYK